MIKPNFVIVIDSLASSSINRLNKTIQITDTGVAPGSGVKNKRPKIDTALLSLPVISIGFPTVMNSATMIYDCLEKNKVNNVSTELEQTLQNTVSYYVTVNEIDEITNTISDVIANAINIATSLDPTYNFSYEKLK